MKRAINKGLVPNSCNSNGMLHHSYLRVGEDIYLQHFIAPSFEFLLCLSVCLSLSLFPFWLDVQKVGANLITESRVKGAFINDTVYQFQ